MDSRPVELLRLYIAGLSQHRYLSIFGVALAVALSLPAVRLWLGRVPRGRTWLVGAVVAGGLAWAWSLRWLCDDAYISFRYTANLVEGNGMVWNVGERVEGYTNFLWAVMMAPFMALGVDPGQPALFLGLACFAAVILLVARLEVLLGPERSPTAVPIGAILAAASFPLATFATSGLETMFITLMALVAVERAHAGRPLTAGLAGIAGVMAHPDQAILYVSLGAVLLTYRRWRQIAAYGAPFLLIYLPYFLIRWRYYAQWPSATEAAGQQEAVGNVGWFVNSFVPRAGDAAKGTLVSRPLTLRGDLMTLRIAGGRDPERLRVSLLVDGQRVASATGCGNEFLGRRAWNIARWKGRPAILEIVDHADGGWGHVMVDEISEWRRR
jgi:hypothetical protein